MIATKQQLIDALCKEYEFLCHDDFDPDVDPTPEEYRSSLQSMSYDELVEETSTDEYYTLEDFLFTYSTNNIPSNYSSQDF